MRWLVAAVGAVAMMALPAPALAQEPVACTESVDIGWEVDHDAATVTAAIVEASGCEDGDLVGVQLQLDDGSWTPEDPLVTEVVDERAHVDLSALGVGMEPVVGVRVALYGDALVEMVEIVVDARFFNPAGNEQRGLREVTELDVEVGGRYHVPDAPARYRDVACATVGVDTRDVVGQGTGTFTATTAGRHVACYQQQAGGAQEPDETDVLGEQVERPSVVGAPAGPGGGSSGPGALGVTGSNALVLGAGALVLLVAGGRLVRRPRPS